MVHCPHGHSYADHHSDRRICAVGVAMSIPKAFFSGMRRFGEALGGFCSTLLLIVVYVLGIGPAALAAKLIRKKFLSLGKEDRETYWEDLHVGPRKREEYHRQF